MIKEPEDEAFEELEKAQQRNALLVDKGCAERGCMGYDDRDGDAPVEMSIHRPWVGLTDDETERLIHNFGSDPHTLLDEVNARLKEKNT